ncbi:MAG: hypothetical protein ACHQQQ_01305 [Bacteroidota bacterium]
MIYCCSSQCHTSPPPTRYGWSTPPFQAGFTPLTPTAYQKPAQSPLTTRNRGERGHEQNRRDGGMKLNLRICQLQTECWDVLYVEQSSSFAQERDAHSR